jgi:hypothetical protein
MAVDVVTSVGETTAGSSAMVEVGAAVRARERVHRLPFTVVIDSCGVAMQAMARRRKRQQGLSGRGEETILQALWALWAY